MDKLERNTYHFYMEDLDKRSPDLIQIKTRKVMKRKPYYYNLRYED